MLLYEGKEKWIYRTDDPELYHIEYKDNIIISNGGNKAKKLSSAFVKNQMTGLIFNMLEKQGVPTHFIKLLSDNEQLVKAVDILPLEVITRNVIAGAMAKRLGIPEGTETDHTIIELCYKNDEFGDPFINDDHAIALGLATADQLETIRTYTYKINEILKSYFEAHGTRLIDFKLEFGLHKGQVILADEMSPDKCRLTDLYTNEKVNKERSLFDRCEVSSLF